MHMSFNFGEEILIIKGFIKMSFIVFLVGSCIWSVIVGWYVVLWTQF